MIMRALHLCVALLWLAPTVGGAQQPGERRSQRVPATIILIDSLTQPGASFVIMRRPGSTPADVVLLRSDADAAQLSDAIRGLLTARHANGDVAPSAATFRVRPHSGRGASPRNAFPWTPRVLNDLRRAEPRPVSGFGVVRSIQIWLPRQGAGRAKPPR